MPYVSHRWLGGLLTNFTTIEYRIKRMHELHKLQDEGQLQLLPTKERMALERELEKLDINLGGVSNMTRLPDVVFVADPKREAIATKEVNKLGIPLVGLVDTNCDPDEVDYLIPGNDDAIRSCSLIVKTLARAVEEGRQKVQIAEFLAAEEARERAASAAKVPVGEEGAGEAAPSRVSRSSRPQQGQGQGRGGQGGRQGGPGGRGGRSDDRRPAGRDAGPAARTAPARRPRPEAAAPAAAPAPAVEAAPAEAPAPIVVEPVVEVVETPAAAAEETEA
jgi:small subunit ribosomal protein S2